MVNNISAPDFGAICNETITITREVGEFIRAQRKIFSMDKVEEKGKSNFVSYVDKTAEEMLVSRLMKLFPEAGFITEENTINKPGEVYNWIIDPLDGTTNFIHGLPPYSISIGLANAYEVLMGVVYEITHDECFYAWKNGGAYLNGEKISVTKAAKVDDSFIVTGFPYITDNRIKGFLQLLEHLVRNSHGVRRLGSAAVDMAYVACGRFEAFFEYGLNPWDVAAGSVIVREAGGNVSDFKGGDTYLFGKELAVTNGTIHEEFTGLIRKYMYPTEEQH
jgi:myo-inositol-1(or 4)-monophosphatase